MLQNSGEPIVPPAAMNFGDTIARAIEKRRTISLECAAMESGRSFSLIAAIQEAKTKLALAEHAALKAEASSKAKSDFLANMIHEIRTPLGAIAGLAKLMHAAPLNTQQKDCLNMLQNCAESLINMISNSLDIDRIESGSVNLDHAPFNIYVLMQHIVSVLSVKAAEKNIDLALICPPGLWKTYVGDSGRIRQIMMNLVGNAIKFTETGGVTITLAGGGEGNGSRLVDMTVTDTGIGIAADKIDVVFDRFVQADPSIAHKFGGSGLGLSISKALAESMGGTLTAASMPGKGSNFTLRLNLPAAHI